MGYKRKSTAVARGAFLFRSVESRGGFGPRSAMLSKCARLAEGDEGQRAEDDDLLAVVGLSVVEFEKDVEHGFSS
jgi:hypothetical protein